MSKDHEQAIWWTVAAVCAAFTFFATGVVMQRWTWEQDCRETGVHVTSYGNVYKCELMKKL
jgi:hypothetical protein